MPAEAVVIHGRVDEVPLAVADREIIQIDHHRPAIPVTQRVPHSRIPVDNTRWKRPLKSRVAVLQVCELVGKDASFLRNQPHVGRNPVGRLGEGRHLREMQIPWRDHLVQLHEELGYLGNACPLVADR
jgi:hypothetical protein